MTPIEADPALAAALVDAARAMSRQLADLRFSPPVSHVYNPLDYARAPAEAYLKRYGASRKRVVFVGMNPGPFGMVQTGVPFGEIAAVRDWMGLEATVATPPLQNPKRPIEGFACTRSEVSGRRLWGLFAERFGRAEHFFADHLVANYCPLAFFDGGRNLTPDKLPAAELRPLQAICDAHLRRMLELLEPEWVIGVGAWAEGRAKIAAEGLPVRFGRVLHPSPASPAANRGWSEAASRQLRTLGVWDDRPA
ncbi:MAG: single-stranded DNA-binding protein [Zoogloeaceae bacterium]|nr:single-stranded DNA-binding protein [Rhodocyclaceae bacterium]MCP5237813.1 single-stranded DNA-binding protein [Zoogloeaceae bacterium]